MIFGGPDQSDRGLVTFGFKPPIFYYIELIYFKNMLKASDVSAVGFFKEDKKSSELSLLRDKVGKTDRITNSVEEHRRDCASQISCLECDSF